MHTHDSQTLVLLCVIVFFAATARGYTGFGLSAIVITIASYQTPAHELVPLLILLEITASLLFFRSLFYKLGNIDWKMITIIFSGAAITTPLALQLLIKLPTDITHATIACLALTATVILLFGKHITVNSNNSTWLVTGLIMGTFGGLGSIGGLAGMVALLSTNIDATKVRATMMVLLLLTSVYAAVFANLSGSITTDSIKYLLFLFLPMTAGLYLGHIAFIRYKRSFRTFALVMLLLLCGVMLLQSLYQILS